MTGFIAASSQYDNATLDNWLMMLGGGLAHRICGASVEYDSSAGKTDVNNILGGISPNTTRSSTGLQQHQYSPSGGKNVMAMFPMCNNINNQCFVYEATKNSFKIMTLAWGGADFELSDVAYWVYTIGR